MPRALIKILVSLTLALGLTLTVSPGNAHAATSPSVARATTPAACANQQAWVNSAQHALARAQRALRKTQHAQGQSHHAEKVRAARARVAKARNTLADARAHRDTCVRNHQTSPTVTAASPVQALCDAGVPQPICDALAGLASSIPSGLSIADLCAQIPNAQALCNAIAGATSGGLDTSALQSVLTQVLNALGLTDLLNQLGLGDLLNLLNQLI